ncbi:hypothetical protein C1645_819701 [Glomus cerebriforme]|uniref:Uncharacterized protein n=1 Tax=Glomus cerebriforme TaxID=658196 RepID=A0A397T786_9GLOM|nr:hypothetical protein C1645_819701 [Glomus cerebriforme]
MRLIQFYTKDNKIQYNLHGLFKLQKGIYIPLNLSNGIELEICVFDENKKTLKFYIDEANIDIGRIEFMIREEYDNCKCEECDICNICKEYKEYDIREDYKKSDPRKVHYIPNIESFFKNSSLNRWTSFLLRMVLSLFRSPELIEGIFLIMTTIECGKIEKFDDNEEKTKFNDGKQKNDDDNEEKSHSIIGIENDDAIMIEKNDM